MGLFSAGSCKFTCSFERDMLFPGDQLNLNLTIDNSKCSSKIDKYKIKLLRRTQVFNPGQAKPIYTNDVIMVSEKMDAKCPAKTIENKDF